MVLQTLVDGRAVILVHFAALQGIPPSLVPVEQVFGISPRIETGILADLVVDALHRQPPEHRIVKGEVWHGAHVHLQQPVIDHKVTGHIPQDGVTILAAHVVAEGGVEELVGQDELPALQIQAAVRVDVELPELTVHRRHRDPHTTYRVPIIHNGERGRQRP